MSFNDYVDDIIVPVHDWDMEANSVPQNDDGTASPIQLQASTGATFEADGDVPYEQDDAISMAGSNTTLRTSGFVALPNTSAPGSFAIVFKDSGALASGGILLGLGSSSTSDSMFFRIFINSSGNDFCRLDVKRSNVTEFRNDSGAIAANTFDDGDYHFVVCVQPGDGSGMRWYMDGVYTGTALSTIYTGSSDIDDWLSDRPTSGNVIFTNHAAGNFGRAEIAISRAWLTDYAMTATEISELQILRSQSSLQAGANTRRKGRKFFPLGT